MTPASDSTALGRQLAYLVFRITLGLNIGVLGAVRIFGPGAPAFATSMANEFKQTALPADAIYGFMIVVPFAEFALGLLTTLALFTRWTLTSGGVLIAILVLGTALRGDWNTLAVQMIYAMTYYLLLVSRSNNRISLDTLLLARRRKPAY
jgi:thiosulfate dehydrogenase [quinone] large subunit